MSTCHAYSDLQYRNHSLSLIHKQYRNKKIHTKGAKQNRIVKRRDTKNRFSASNIFVSYIYALYHSLCATHFDNLITIYRKKCFHACAVISSLRIMIMPYRRSFSFFQHCDRLCEAKWRKKGCKSLTLQWRKGLKSLNVFHWKTLWD